MSEERIEKYLAWDTASVSGVIAAIEVRGNTYREVVSWSLSLETSRHSERLLWSIDTVLQSAGWKLEDLSGIAVGIGPGSFTGIRIGVTTARILAKTLGIEVVPFSSLALLSRGVIAAIDEGIELFPKQQKSLESTLLIACTDATKGEWFTCMGRAKAVRDCLTHAEGDIPGVWGVGVVEKVFTPEELFAEIKAKLKKMGASAKWVAVGQSVERYPELWETLPQKSRVVFESEVLKKTQATHLAKLVFQAVKQGLKRDPSSLKPRYLRGSEAEVKLQKGLLKLSPILHRGGVA